METNPPPPGSQPYGYGVSILEIVSTFIMTRYAPNTVAMLAAEGTVFGDTHYIEPRQRITSLKDIG
jgi:hypothetical protein